jgi:hypothetical protein
MRYDISLKGVVNRSLKTGPLGGRCVRNLVVNK